MKFDYGNEIVITACGGSGCSSLNSKKIIENLRNIISEKHLNIKVKQTGCHGFCEAGPIVVIKPPEILYTHVKPDDCEDIIKGIENGYVVERLLFKQHHGKRVERKVRVNELDFYRHQTRLLLKRCGNVDPYSIGEYIENGGYLGLRNSLGMKSGEVIEVVKSSGLRGRGGGGFPTGVKWSFIAMAKGEKYLVANGDEGDPGSFMDRTLMEGDPFSLIEGMTIAAYAVGATRGFIYVRAEYPESVKILNNAISEARKNGYLGENILGQGFSFDIEIRLGAGAFVCGEETALMNSIEGKRGMPRPRPPFPAQRGIFGKPTNINNVKTYAYVSHILREGIEWFRRYGNEKSPGTAVLALTGKVNHTGIVEVPMGTKLRDVVFTIGGGVKGNKKFKAVLTGGPSGGALPEDKLDLGIDYESLTSAGSIMGSGGVLVLDEDDDMVDVADFFIQFCMSESCGKCTPCREGTVRIHEILDKIKKGKGTENDLVELEELGRFLKDTSLCGLGQTAPNPTLTTLRYFKDDYYAKMRKNASGNNKVNFKYYFITDKCVGCNVCSMNCPMHCISGEVKEQHVIDQTKCIGCGSCYRNCHFDAIIFNEENLKKDGKVVPHG